jgi:hypothetical protein
MQASDGINFDLAVHKPEFHAWEVVLALILFVGLICWAVWWSRKRSKENRGSLNINGS